MAVSKRLRYEILKRDDHTCRYCGASAPDVKLAVDHVVPEALGGTSEPSNLVAACVDCNAGKSASAPDAALVEDVNERALKWSQAMQQAAEQRLQERAEVDAFVTQFDAIWCSWRWTKAGTRIPYDAPESDDEYISDRPDDWRSSIERLYALGLEMQHIDHAVDVAMRARLNFSGHYKLFRYFMGVCNKELEKRVALASEMLA